MRLPWTCTSCGKLNYHYAPCWCGMTREPQELSAKLRANAALKQYQYTRAPELMRLAADTLDKLTAQVKASDGHDEPCVKCGAACNSLAGDPSLWPVALANFKEPGTIAWWHCGCASAAVERDLSRGRDGQDDTQP